MANSSPLLSDLVGVMDNLHDPYVAAAPFVWSPCARPPVCPPVQWLTRDVNSTPIWNHKSVIIGWTLAAQLVTLLCATARLYTRFFVIKSPWWDDLFVVLVLLCSVIGSVTMGISTEHGMGQHLLLLSAADITAYKEVFYVGFGVFLMSGIFVKLALLFQFLRIFQAQPNLIRVCRYLIIVTVAYGIIVTFLAWFPCFPPSLMWQETEPIPESACFGFGSFRQNGLVATYVSTAVVNLFLDLCCLAVPVPLFFRRETTQRAKVGLTALLLLGGSVNGLALWRVVVSIDTKVGTYPTYDPTWYAPTSTMPAIFEVNASVICASIPVFWPVLASKFGDIIVTREVKVETSPRDEGGPQGCGDDEVQLWSPADVEWQGGRGYGEDGGYPPKKAHTRAQGWPMATLATVESTVTAKHDNDPVVLETVLLRPDGGKWV